MINPQVDVGSFPKAPDDSQYKLRTLWEKEMGQTSTPVKHDKTSVLMLSWRQDDDDLGVTKEVCLALIGCPRDQQLTGSRSILWRRLSRQATAFMSLRRV